MCADCEAHKDDDVYFIMEDGTILAVDFDYEDEDEEDQEMPHIDLSDLTGNERQEILEQHNRGRDGPMTRSRLMRVAAIRRIHEQHSQLRRSARAEREEEKKCIQEEVGASCRAQRSATKPKPSEGRKYARGMKESARKEESREMRGANELREESESSRHA